MANSECYRAFAVNINDILWWFYFYLYVVYETLTFLNILHG